MGQNSSSLPSPWKCAPRVPVHTPCLTPDQPHRPRLPPPGKSVTCANPLPAGGEESLLLHRLSFCSWGLRTGWTKERLTVTIPKTANLMTQSAFGAGACRGKSLCFFLIFIYFIFWLRWAFFFLIFIFYLSIYLFRLCWVFISVRGLSLVAASGGHSSLRCAGLSLSRPLLLRSTGSRRTGSVIVAHGPSCSAACGIFPDQGSNPCPLRRHADSQPLRHQGSPR